VSVIAEKREKTNGNKSEWAREKEARHKTFAVAKFN